MIKNPSAPTSWMHAACASLLLTLFLRPGIAGESNAVPNLEWAPAPFVYDPGESQRYIDYENGDDNNPGTRENPWKHHPWDAEATGNAAAGSGIQTYVFKRGVVYRGTLDAGESGEPGNPIRLTVDPDWGTGEAVIAGSMRVDVPWTPYDASTGLPFPEASRDQIWMADLGMDLDPKLCWLVNGPEISQLPIAREPDWEVSNPNNPMTEWWIWTDEKSTGKIFMQSSRTEPGTQGFSPGETIWISDGDETPQEIEENRANSTIVVTAVENNWLTVTWGNGESLSNINGKIFTDGVVYRETTKDLNDARKVLIDDVNLTEPDPDFYKNALVRAEHFSYAGYGHPSRVSRYSPTDHSVTLSYWIPSLLRNGREPQTNCRYYFEGKPQFLDSPGEFYYDKTADRLFVRLPGDQDPNTAHIEIARNHLLVNMEDQNHIEISGLAMRFENMDDWFDCNQDNAAVRVMGNCTGIKISHCSFEHVIKQKAKNSTGPAKVDAQFMAVALATYFTSDYLAGNIAEGYGFNVTATGIGTKIVNVGSKRAAFGVADDTDLTILQLLWATDSLTDTPDDLSGFAHIYDQNGDGVIDSAEAALRTMANHVYSAINEQGDI